MISLVVTEQITDLSLKGLIPMKHLQLNLEFQNIFQQKLIQSMYQISKLDGMIHNFRRVRYQL